jgi:hypothetical protein
MLNEVKGLPVIFSDSAGNAETLSTDKVSVQHNDGSASTLELAPPVRGRAPFRLMPLGPDGKPLANAGYRLLTPAGEILTGTTDGSGALEVDLPPATLSVDAHITPDGRPHEPLDLELPVSPHDGGTK